MHRSCRSAAATAALAVMLAGTGLVTAAGQGPDGRTEMALMATSATTGVLELRRLDGLVDAMARTGELTLASQRPDRQLPGRVHEGFRQYHEAVPVHGGGVSGSLPTGPPSRSSARSTRGSTSTRRRACRRARRSP